MPRSYTVYDLPTGRDDRLSPDSPEDVELLWSKGFDASIEPDPSLRSPQSLKNPVRIEAHAGVSRGLSLNFGLLDPPLLLQGSGKVRMVDPRQGV